MAVILVQRHAHQILPIARDALVLDRARTAIMVRSDELAADPALLDG